MNKKIFAAVAVALAGAFAAPVFAQNTCPRQGCDPAKCAPEKCTKADCKNPCADAKCPFDNLNLTADQKTKLKALNTERRQKAAEARKDRKQCGKECRADYLAKVKEILTPEQYVKFLESNYTDGAARPRQQMHGKHGHDRKADCKRQDCTANKKK